MDCWAWAVSMGIGVSMNVNSRVVAPKNGETVLSRAKLFFMGSLRSSGASSYRTKVL
jgi:hypothetical protein